MLKRFFATLLLWFAAAGAFAAGEPLDPNKAYVFSARAFDANTIEVEWRIARNYYMYKDKIKFAADPDTVKLGAPQLPAGKIKDDEFFGKVETYRGTLKFLVPIVERGGATAFTLKATSQGCWDEGVCYPPLPQEAKIDFGAVASATAPAPARAVASDGDESSRVADLLRHGEFWLILASFLGFGLLLSLTPCVFPMVPILSGIIVNHGHAVTHARAFVLSGVYVLGMAATYAIIGVAAGFSGTLLSAAFQNPWVLSAFALIFVVLALSMFGFYEIQLPTALQSKLSDTANRQGGSLHAIALMGALSALICGPCVAAPLAGALLYIAQTKDAVLGGAALFAMGVGMGLPLLAVGVFSRSLLPKAGPWMEAVKKFFGVVMLATALWFVSPVIPAWTQMLGWAALLIVPAIYMHALDPLPAHAGGWHKLWKGIGVALLLTGAAMLAGLLGGARDPLQPLGFLKPTATSAPGGAEKAVKFERVASTAELDAALAASTKPVMLDFYADWCVSCKEMEKFTFTDPKVAATLARFTLLQADVTANSEADIALLKRFGLFGPPGIIFFDAKGAEAQGLRVVGFMAAEKFQPILERALRQ